LDSTDIKQESPRNTFKDGFRKKNDILIWDGDSNNTMNQNVYYLHGSIFIFTEDGYPFKIQNKESLTISHQVRSYLESGKTPLIILEGKYKDKLKIIQTYPYLYHAFNSLSLIKDNLFIYGFSMNIDSDMHIIEQIQKSNCKNIFLSYYDDGVEELERKVDLLTKNSTHKEKVNVFVFKSIDAIKWSPSTNL
jgi:hypothetical protein